MKNTITGIHKGITVSVASVQDDSFTGIMLARHADYGMAFVWAYSESVTGGRFPASRIAVKRDFWVDSEPGDFSDGVRKIRPSGTEYLQAGTLSDIVVYDDASGKIVVPFGPVGFGKAVSRWIRDNMAPFTIEFKDYDGHWCSVASVPGLEAATLHLDALRSGYPEHTYRIARNSR